MLWKGEVRTLFSLETAAILSDGTERTIAPGAYGLYLFIFKAASSCSVHFPLCLWDFALIALPFGCNNEP